jgi:nucleotide-binding universal stress UspA family protein
MSRFSNVLLSTDFTTCSDHAKRYAYAFAKQPGGILHIAHAVEVTPYPYSLVPEGGAIMEDTLREIRFAAKEHLDADVEEAKEMGVQTKGHLLEGYPPEQIDALALNLGCDLLVVGTHGRSGLSNLVHGSTCSKILRASPAPVLSVKEKEHEFVDEEGHISINRVLCPVDFSRLSEEALPAAADICRRFGASLLLYHVVDSRIEYPLLTPSSSLPMEAHLQETSAALLEKLQASLSDIETDIDVVLGVPGKEIVRAAASEDVDLVVMSTHGRQGLSHALLGSTTEKVATQAPCPVLTIKPQMVIADTKEQIPDAVVV